MSELWFRFHGDQPAADGLPRVDATSRAPVRTCALRVKLRCLKDRCMENRDQKGNDDWMIEGGFYDQSVVDKDLKVHGISNLFINGSSVFRTGSYNHPTYTIVKLALRLSNHLSKL